MNPQPRTRAEKIAAKHEAEQAEKRKAAAAAAGTAPEQPDQDHDQDQDQDASTVLSEVAAYKPATRDHDGFIVAANDETAKDEKGNDVPAELWTDYIAKGRTVKADGLRAGIHYAWRNGVDPTQGKTALDALQYLRQADTAPMPAFLVAWLVERPYIPEMEGQHPDGKPGGNKQQGHWFKVWWNRNMTGTAPANGTRDTTKATLQVNAMAAYMLALTQHNAAIQAHYAAGGKPADAPAPPELPDLDKVAGK